MRLKIIQLIICIIFLGLVVGLVHTQVIKGNQYYELSRYNRIRIVPIEGSRGRILDRNNVVLADTRVSFDVMVVPQEVDDKINLFSFLGKILDIDEKILLKAFKNKSSAPFIPVIIKENIDREKAIVLEENKFRFPGLIINVGAKRNYPFKDIGAHVLGYIGRIDRAKIKKFKDYGYSVQDLTGYSGIEEYYDNFLRGEDGGRQIEVNNKGEQVCLLGMKSPTNGQDVTLTIDSRIQLIANKVLLDKRGVIIVLDLDSGEVLGMISSPSFDPNIFSGTGNSAEKTSLFSDSAAPLMNRAISGQYPPGSVFKIPLAVAALNEQKVSLDRTFFCNGAFRLGRRSFRCSHSHGVQNFTEAIAHSCNVYFYNVGLLLGPEIMQEYAYLLGLGSRTNIDLPHEEEGSIPSSKKIMRRSGRTWSKGDTLNFSIGQGDFLATPIQLVNTISTIARKGKEISPHIMKAVGDEVDAKEIFLRNIDNVSQDYFESVKVGMKAAVGDYSGTAHLLNMKDILVFGKTGTAQSSGRKASHAWFVGFCPETKTRIAFCVFLEHGGSSYNACRMARRLLRRMKKANIL